MKQEVEKNDLTYKKEKGLLPNTGLCCLVRKATTLCNPEGSVAC